MKDKWMNIGHEDDELVPFIEPTPDYNDSNKIGKLYRDLCGAGSHAQRTAPGDRWHLDNWKFKIQNSKFQNLEFENSEFWK